MKFEQVSNLAQVVAKFRPKQINIIEENGADKASQLYNLIISHPELNSEEALKQLYPTGSKRTFEKLTLRLRDKLTNMLFFIDLRGPKFSTSLKAIAECYRNLAVFFLLIRFQQRSLAIEIGEKLVKQAMKFDLTEVTYPVLKSLCLHYSSVVFNARKYKYFNDLLEAEFQNQKDKHIVDDLYCYIFGQYAHTRASNKAAILEMVSERVPELVIVQERSNSFFVQRRAYLIRILYAQIIGDADEALNICDAALNYFTKEAKIESKVTILNFIIQKLAIHVKVRDFKAGKEAYDQGMAMTSHYSHDWNVLQYLYFLLSMHTGQYEEALKTYNAVTKDKKFVKAAPFFNEVWSIFEAYVYIVATHSLDAELPTFSATRYINNIPTFSKDKKGNNVSILIAHFILLLLQGKDGQALDRVDALKMYAHRYLREDETIRSNCFIKMLMALARANFNPIRARRYAERYEKKLRSTPMQLSEQSSEIEIVPYEELWEIVLQLTS
jgi:hypothetical protein